VIEIIKENGNILLEDDKCNNTYYKEKLPVVNAFQK